MKKNLKINEVYLLAGKSSAHKCLTVACGYPRVAIMQNLNTGKIRSYLNLEITGFYEAQWDCSTELDESFTLKTYFRDGTHKITLKHLDWNHVLHLWKSEVVNGFPAPTIWLDDRRLVDGPILLEGYWDCWN